MALPHSFPSVHRIDRAGGPPRAPKPASSTCATLPLPGLARRHAVGRHLTSRFSDGCTATRTGRRLRQPRLFRVSCVARRREETEPRWAGERVSPSPVLARMGGRPSTKPTIRFSGILCAFYDSKIAHFAVQQSERRCKLCVIKTSTQTKFAPHDFNCLPESHAVLHCDKSGSVAGFVGKRGIPLLLAQSLPGRDDSFTFGRRQRPSRQTQLFNAPVLSGCSKR